MGFLSRPLGGVIFGRMGDRQGRKAALVATLLLMGVSTLLIGFLPSYRADRRGGAAGARRLRFLQGVGVGGEWGGAVLLALESGHRGRRGLLASWPQVGVPLGLVAFDGRDGAVRAVSAARRRFLRGAGGFRFSPALLLIVVGFLIRRW